MGVCKLCQQEKELRKSHIYPEFLFKPLYDAKHEYLLVKSKTEIRKRPKGIYEHLFCESCEKIFNTYENYAAKKLFSKNKTENEVSKNDVGFVFHNVNYSKFKLFELSLFWRPSVASRPEVKKIQLGPHGEKIRLMLLNGDPGKYFEYGCAIFFLPKQPPEFKAVIIQPHDFPQRIDGHRGYRAIFNGLFWTFIVSSHTEQFEMRNFFLQENGDLPIVNSGQHGWEFILKWAAELSSDAT